MAWKRDRRAGNLPAELSTFVGRQVELAELGWLLKSARLVTVTGVGGVGKTRTALRAAQEVSGDYPDGVWLVELSGLRDGELLAGTVAESLGLHDQSTRPQLDVLAAHLADRQLLLVLDTCEHLLNACALLVEVLLDAAPRLQVLVTSRRPLDIRGEDIFVVPPLPVPDPEHPEAGDADCDSVRLFADRAQAADAGFAVTAGNQELVTRLCHRLDGLPLAIELAAARLRTLPLEQIIERLDDRFRLLTGGDRTALPRHETLRTTIGWSHELCRPPERLLWARLSVFSGGFDLAAARAVCADDRLPAHLLPELFTGLEDKSVLTRDEHGDGVRYRLLDTLREYGQEWLDALGGETAHLARRHRDYYLRLAARFAARWCGPDQLEWSARMAREHANLRSALDHCLAEPGERHLALDFVDALWLFWLTGGFIREGRHYLDRALELNPAPSPTRTCVLGTRSRFAAVQGDVDGAGAGLAEGHAAAETQGDLAMAEMEHAIAGRAFLRGDYTRTAELTAHSAELYATTGETGGEVYASLLLALLLQGTALAAQGENERAVEVLTECRRRCERVGEQWTRSFAAYTLGLTELDRGDIAAANRFGREALRFRRQLSDSLGTALTFDLLASAAAAGGDGHRAARLHGAAHQVWHTFGLPQFGSPSLADARARCERQARDSLGDSAYERAFEDGRGLEPDAAIAYALGEAQSG